jgi:hypothetical protein
MPLVQHGRKQLSERKITDGAMEYSMAPGHVLEARWRGDGNWYPATLGVQSRPGQWQVKANPTVMVIQ